MDTVILNLKHFNFFVSDKPLSSYDGDHPPTYFSKSYVQLQFLYTKINKINEIYFFNVFEDFSYQTQ